MSEVKFNYSKVENGCRYHPDCFTCPLDDCRFDYCNPSQRRKNRSKYYEANREKVLQQRREYYQKNKEEINRKRREERRIVNE